MNRNSRLFPRFKEWGFESVEISIEDFSHIDPIYIKDKLGENNLVCGSVTPCLGPDKDLRGSLQQQRTGVKFMKDVVKVMTTMGAQSLIGVVYSTVGRTEAVPRNEYRKQWRTVVRNLKELAEFAGENGKTIALEPINRFETDFINTCDRGLEMISDVGSAALKLHLDTFHMNIEEKDPAAAIRRAGNYLGHLHACGCDRGTPGSDHIDWNSIADALHEIRYNGDVVIESFTADVKALARAASIWRAVEPTRDEIAWKGAKFLKSILRNGVN
jgi:D-psicose/D-tagatose/L-ribulose 3-epimerase